MQAFQISSAMSAYCSELEPRRVGGRIDRIRQLGDENGKSAAREAFRFLAVAEPAESAPEEADGSVAPCAVVGCSARWPLACKARASELASVKVIAFDNIVPCLSLPLSPRVFPPPPSFGS